MASLTTLALRYLERTAWDAQNAPAPQTLELRLALAWLHTQCGGSREPFDAFWKAVTLDDDATQAGYLRLTYGTIALRRICRALGMEGVP